MRPHIGSSWALVEISRDREEALGAEEPAVGDFRQPARAQRLRKFSARLLDRIGMIDRPIALAAAGFVVAGEHRDALQQRRFPGAVFADDDGDGAIQVQLEIIAQKRQAERIGLAVGDPRRIEPQPLQIRRRHVDGAISSGTHTLAPRWSGPRSADLEHNRNIIPLEVESHRLDLAHLIELSQSASDRVVTYVKRLNTYVNIRNFR